MEANKIRALLCAVEKKSLSKAAEEFAYTPSALSHAADSVEEELGVKILKRSYAGVTLTDEGEKLLPALQAFVKAEDRLLLSARALSEEGELRIAAYSSISLHVLPEIVKAFKLAYPSVKVSISVGNQLKNALLEGVADVVFSDTPSEGGAEWREILTEPFVAVVPAALFAGKKTIRKEELYEHPYISTAESLLQGYFDESKFREITHFSSVDDNSVLSMVKEELGVAVLPALTVKKRIKGIKTVKLEPEIHRTVGYSYFKQNQTEALKSFLHFLRK